MGQPVTDDEDMSITNDPSPDGAGWWSGFHRRPSQIANEVTTTMDRSRAVLARPKPFVAGNLGARYLKRHSR